MLGRVALVVFFGLIASAFFRGATSAGSQTMAVVAGLGFRVMALLVVGALVALFLVLHHRRKVRELHHHETNLAGWRKHPFYTRPDDRRACPGCGADATGWRNWSQHQGACGAYQAWAAARQAHVAGDLDASRAVRAEVITPGPEDADELERDELERDEDTPPMPARASAVTLDAAESARLEAAPDTRPPSAAASGSAIPPADLDPDGGRAATWARIDELIKR